MSEHAQTNPERKRPRRRKHILRKILAVLLILALLAGAGLYAYFSLKQEYTVTYTGYTASIGSISNALSFSGSLNLIDNVTYTAGADGTVRTLYVQAGDDVKEGDKLLRLSNGETVKATFDGRVNSIKVAEGDEVTAGTSLVQVADFGHMKVSIRVDEYDIADVSVGQNCTVTATATEKTFQSTIADIDYISASTGNVAYYTATAYVDVDEGVYPGMQVTITIPQEEAQNVVVLKMDALSFDETNNAFVYMYDENQALVEVPVEVGVSNGNYVEIKSGLSDGDEVFVEAEVETTNAMTGLL
ncbi:MAG: efflux RND transporter periplasmic adaptor subunit, partial [Clostridia bacterium]|nr:efflux RND transporter periplasmic adaptor subunit [Clostridia bacterium]